MSVATDVVCDLSIVMPVYNEERVIEAVINDIRRDILDKVSTAELIVVNDCSTDSTPTVLSRMSDADPRIRIITNARNLGHGPSVRAGLDAACGTWLFHVDSDGQFDIADFHKLTPSQDNADLILGIRHERHDPRHRLILTRATRLFTSRLAGQKLRDVNVPFKLFRRSLWEHARHDLADSVFAPSVLFVLVAARSGARIVEVPVTHLKRPFGDSTLRPLRLARACLRSALELGAARLAPERPYVPPTAS
jgi:dolichol-phosphate mannosyltransferase